MAEARDFHCYSLVFENLGERSVPGTRGVTKANGIQVGWLNILSSVPF